jgi:predicted transcriptional regulator of viral defense system
MDKNIYLRKQEQMVFNAISALDIVNSKELEEEFPLLSAAQLNKIFSQLSAKGYLHRLKKGMYLVQETPSKFPYIKNPYKVGLALFKGYVGFSSALRVYHLLDYAPFTIFVVTVNKSREREVGEYTFKAVSMGERAVGVTFHEGIYISTVAKTFFDCFYKPHYCGGYSAITKALYDAEALNWDEFLSYFDEFASASLCQRTGYILELIREETGKTILGLEKLSGRVKNNTKLVPSGKAGGKYIKGWKVLDNLGKENILSWWYHG